ncbi:MAG: hypothetical protein ACPG05_02265 [Bdellovibrionales bacterium]
MVDEKEDISEVHLLEMVQMSVSDGQKAWALLSMSPEDYEVYKLKADSGEAMDINKYGDVLAYKVGAEAPTPEEEKELIDKFGYHPNLDIEEKLATLLGMSSED